MAGIESNEAGLLKNIIDGNYKVDKRMLLDVCVYDGESGRLIKQNTCINDVVIARSEMVRMVRLNVSCDEDRINEYYADGIIVATPTGSTAYSLSNGGPIIVPGTGVLLMTAVAPHSLNIRPIVIPDRAEITLEVESRSHSFLVAIDGLSETCGEGTTITLRRAPYNIKVVKRSGKQYFATLREKMMWGADVR
jgi:NAD+ kinase